MSTQRYRVQTPFKSGKSVLKPPFEFDAKPDDVAVYLDAGVIAPASNTAQQRKEATPASSIAAGAGASEGESDAGNEGRGEGAGNGPVAPVSSAPSRSATTKAPPKKAATKTTAAKATK
ncbi:hypothetical protein [Leptolyngbya phage Lsp-JY19]